MSSQMSSLLGSTGTVGPTPGQAAEQAQPGFVGPPVPSNLRQGASGALGGLSGALDKVKSFTDFLGDTPEEREKNAQRFAALVKDVGNMGKNISESTLMQRMMKESMKRPMAALGGGEPAGGVSPIPKTFDPATAGAIMSRFGFSGGGGM